MKKVYLTALLCLSFIMMLSLTPTTKAHAIKEIEVDHTFKVTFSKEVDLEQAKDYIKLSPTDYLEKELSFHVSYGDTKKVVYVKPDMRLFTGTEYRLSVKEGMASKDGHLLKTKAYQLFVVKKSDKVLAPIDATVNAHIQHYKKRENDDILIYGGANVSQQTIDALAAMFRVSIQDYLTTFFPDIISSKKKATVVVLGNEADQQTYANAGGFVSPNASGWFSHADNIIVMTKDAVNTNLLTHEYMHWMFKNVYNLNVPTGINEGFAYLYAVGYVESKMNPLEISLVKSNIKTAYLTPVPNFDLTKTYNAQIGAALGMILHEHGMKSLHHVLVDAQNSSLEQAWEKHYNVNFMNTINYTYKASSYYENYLTEKGYDLDGLVAYNNLHKDEKPISNYAFDTQLQLFGKYKLVETPMYRIYASPSVSAETLETVLTYTKTLTQKYDTQMATRPLLVLASHEEAATLAQDNGKSSVIGYGYLRNSFVLPFTTPNQLTESYKNFIESCLTKYYVK